jgi:hypothetical protein
MTWHEIRESVALLLESQKETDRQLKEARQETERLFQNNAREQEETARQLRELGKQLGGLGDKFGSYTEGLALPAMTKILTQRFHMDTVAARAQSRRNGRTFEVDVLAYSESGIDEVYIVEVKSHLREEALDQMKKILAEFHEFFPGHRHKKVYGILAAVEAPEPVRQKVLREGIYLARVHDGQFELQVPEGFQPRAY